MTKLLLERIKKWFKKLFKIEVAEEEIKFILIYNLWDKRDNHAWLTFQEEELEKIELESGSKLTQTLAIKMARCYKEHMEKWKK